MSRPPDITTIIVCDDVRKEITNKDILIGVYTGDIVVQDFPAWVRLSVWIEMLPSATGEHHMTFRVGMTDRTLSELMLRLQIREIASMGISLPNTAHLIEKETEFVVELKEGTEWRSLKRKKIIKGRVEHYPPVGFLPPTAPA